jgi:hypothetical protein
LYALTGADLFDAAVVVVVVVVVDAAADVNSVTPLTNAVDMFDYIYILDIINSIYINDPLCLTQIDDYDDTTGTYSILLSV